MLMDDGTVQPFLKTLGIKPKARYTIEDILFRNFLPTASVVFRNRFISEIPEEAYHILAGDWLLHITNAQYGDIIYIDEIMSCYRIHQQGFWTSLGQVGMLKEKIKIYGIQDSFLSYKYTKLIKKMIQNCESQLADLNNVNIM